jgi:hypothetical protein
MIARAGEIEFLEGVVSITWLAGGANLIRPKIDLLSHKRKLPFKQS